MLAADLLLFLNLNQKFVFERKKAEKAFIYALKNAKNEKNY